MDGAALQNEKGAGLRVRVLNLMLGTKHLGDLGQVTQPL